MDVSDYERLKANLPPGFRNTPFAEKYFVEQTWKIEQLQREIELLRILVNAHILNHSAKS